MNTIKSINCKGIESNVESIIYNKVEKFMSEIKSTNKFCETEMRLMSITLVNAMYEVARVQAKESK